MTEDLRTRAGSRRAAPPSPERAVALKDDMWRMQEQFQLALPRGMEAARLLRDAMTVMQKTPRLIECEAKTVLGGLMTCAQLGLRLGVLGEAWLVPFKNQAQLIIGYPGYVSLAQRSGQLAGISARMVHEADAFELEYGLEERLYHRPASGARGGVVGYYSVFRDRNGGRYWEHMTRQEAEEHRDDFAMGREFGTAGKPGHPPKGRVIGPWLEYFDAMALKTTVIRASKLAPRTTEYQTAMDVDGSIRMDVSPNVSPAEASYIPEDEAPSSAELTGGPEVGGHA